MENLMKRKVLLQEMEKVQPAEWFDGRNMEIAQESLITSANSLLLGQKKQAGIMARKFATIVKYDSALKALSVFETAGIDAKPFCINNSRNRNFVVRGENFDWQVGELADYRREVPSGILERVCELVKAGLKIDGMAVAVPLKCRMGKIVKEECLKAGKELGVAMGVLASVVILPLALIPAAHPADPVLLVRFGSFYIEVGRWE